MNALVNRRFVFPFVLAFICFPLFVVMHELGHYLTAHALHFHPHFHFAVVNYDVQFPAERRRNEWVGAAGPLVNSLLTAVGLAWLLALRRNRADALATKLDWFATILTINCGRWLRALFSSPADPQPADEAAISYGLGWPQWLLPYALCACSILIFAITIRLHPRGARLIPFTLTLAGGVFGLIVWLKFLGPFLFP